MNILTSTSQNITFFLHLSIQLFKASRMKIQFVCLLTFLLIIISGCSEKEEKPKEMVQEVEFVKQEPRKSRLLIPDTSRIVRLKDIDPNDSISIGVRAFNRAEREFIKKWNYDKDRDLFIDVFDHICREFRECPSMKDSVTYQKEVYFILDSLMRNNILDSLIEARKKEIEERKKLDCYGRDNLTKKCQDLFQRKMKEYVTEVLKKRKINNEK